MQKKKFKNSFVHFTDDEGFCRKLNLPLNRIFTVPEPAEINEMIRHIEFEFFTHNVHYLEQTDSYVRSLLIKLSRCLFGIKSGIVEKNTFKKFFEIRMHILSNLDYDWNTENMAALAHMSKSQFYRYYTTIFHQPPKTELIEARMEYAKYLLTNEALQVGQIARMIGYSNEYHFIRIFKEHYGYSPKQYSKKKRGCRHIPLIISDILFKQSLTLQVQRVLQILQDHLLPSLRASSC